jgi:FkbM family methyltransferase
MIAPVNELDSLSGLLQPERRTAVVDIGANPIGADPPYKRMLERGLCTVVGFEPQADALAELERRKGALESYFPYVVGDGATHTLHVCSAPGMTGLLKPDAHMLSLFQPFTEFGQVVSTSRVATTRLDDIAEIASLDFLKIDVQGAELMVFRGGRGKLAQAVAVQTEVSFMPLYEGQPLWGDVDRELREQGFVPHAFAAVKRWAIAPMIVGGDPRRSLNQLLEADVVYVRDFARPDALADEQLKQLALVAHHCYGSFDLALRCVFVLEKRGRLPQGSRQRYLESLAARKV